MSRGRRSQPAEVKEAKGNPGRRPIRGEKDAAPKLASKAPSELCVEARRVWDQLSPDLSRMKFLRETDRNAFARYCEHLAAWWRLTNDLRVNGEIYVSKSEHNPEGLERVRPNFLIRERIEKRLELLEDRFGLSPAARQQILYRMAAGLPAVPPQGDLPVGEPARQSRAPEASPVGLLGRAVH